MANTNKKPIGIMIRPPFWIISHILNAEALETTGSVLICEPTVSAASGA